MSTFATSSANVDTLGSTDAAAPNAIADTLVGIWDLKGTEKEAPPPERTKILFHLNPGEEFDSARCAIEPVDDFDILPGGKYRSIVKLFCHFSNSKPGEYMHGTGWLIKPDLIVTAGHCVFDWHNKLGYLTEVKAYIGYVGAKSVHDRKREVQFRAGEQAATSVQWLTTKYQRPYDVAFIKVNTPFTDITPIRFIDTPTEGSSMIGVVGYPGELLDVEEKGAIMHEHFENTAWNLEESSHNMLEYTVDTFGGNSGAPVLRRKDRASIGGHVYGGAKGLASVIGPLGNPYNAFIAAFDMPPIKEEKHVLKSIKGLRYVRVPARIGFPKAPIYHELSQQDATKQTGSKSVPSDGAFTSLNDVKWTEPSDKDSFFDFFQDFKIVAMVAAPIKTNVLATGVPLVFGPVSGPITALASVALSYAATLAEPNSKESIEIQQTDNGAVERAILSEAALTAVTSKTREKLEELDAFTKMELVVRDLSPGVQKLAPYLVPAITEPALRIALDALRDSHMPNNKALDLEDLEPKKIPQPVYAPAKLKAGPESFVIGLSAHADTEDGQERSSEDSWSGAKQLISKGVNRAKPLLSAAKDSGLSKLQAALKNRAAAFSDAQDLKAHPHALSLTGLCKRAIYGEAALQFLMQLPPAVLEGEGFFGIMFEMIKKIAPVVIKAAPGVQQGVEPIVQNMLKGGAESVFLAGPEAAKGVGISEKKEKGMSYAESASEF